LASFEEDAMKTRALLLCGSLALVGAACDSSDDSSPGVDAGLPGTPDAAPAPTPTAFTVRIENVAPWTVLKSGTQTIKLGQSAPGPLGPGDAYEVDFTAGKNQKVSFAAMLGESNDWFFAPGPEGIALYDADGMPTSGDVTAQVSLWNAGTEIDQEPAVGDATGPKQSAPDFGAPDPTPGVHELGSVATLSDGSSFALPAITSMIRVTLTPGADRHFTLRLENVSTATTLHTSAGDRAIHVSPFVWAVHIAPAPFFAEGANDRGMGLELIAESGRVAMLGDAIATLSGAATPLSPGVYAVHHAAEPLFSLDQPDRGMGLERIAESGNPVPMATAFSTTPPADVVDTGVFNMPEGATAAGPATPGHAYEIHVSALPGDRLSLVTMFGMSDDWFFGTAPGGLALFDADGHAVHGDQTAGFALYDAGTEVDEELAIGPDTGPQQAAPDQGALDPTALVRLVPAATYAAPVASHLKVTITPE
jgi:hypothetical protein